jgi:hypothetical protein
MAQGTALIEDDTDRHKAFAEAQKMAIRLSAETGIEKEKLIAIFNKEYEAQRKLLRKQEESNEETKKTTEETKKTTEETKKVVETKEKELSAYEQLLALKTELEKQLKNEILANSGLVVSTSGRLRDINEEIKRVEELSQQYQGLSERKIKSNQEPGPTGKTAGGEQKKEKTWWQNFLLGDAEYSEEAMQEAESKLISGLQDVSNQAMDILLKEAEFKEQMIQREIDAQDKRIDEVGRILEIEADLKKQGLANEYDDQKKQYEKLSEQRDKSIREQKRALEEQKKIEQALQLIGMITSSVNIWKGTTSTIPGPAGVALALLEVASLWGSWAYSKSKAQSESMYEHGGSKVLGGKDHNQGGVMIPGVGEAERGEMVSIFSKQATRKHGKEISRLTNMINKDKFHLDKAMIQSNVIISMNDSKIDETNRLLRIMSERTIEGNSIVIRKGLTTRRINLN